MSQSDPTAVLAEMKRTEALLRDARSVLRRVDALAAKASTSDDPSRTLIAEVRTAAEHLVSQLAHRQQTERRSAKQVARRLRWPARADEVGHARVPELRTCADSSCPARWPGPGVHQSERLAGAFCSIPTRTSREVPLALWEHGGG
jgi:hypothetical protein